MLSLKLCKEILEGKHHEQFPVDMIQGGAGTTTNMNANEVIANRALEIMGHKRGEYQYCSPNDHVNRSQSTNDAYPTAIHIGMYYTHLKLVKHFEELINAFQRKAEAFKHIIKMGRTQLEDAVPMTLGQTFNGFASILRNEIKNLNFAAEDPYGQYGSYRHRHGYCGRTGICGEMCEGFVEATRMGRETVR